MALTLNTHFKKDGVEIFEFIMKGDPDILIPKFEMVIEDWVTKNPSCDKIKIYSERGFASVKLELEENGKEAGNYFIDFFQLNLSKQTSPTFSYNLQKSIDLGLCQIHSLEDDSITIQVQNPNRVLRNLNLAIQRIWPGLLLNYPISRYPIFLRIFPDRTLTAEEFVSSTEEKNEIRFYYNPKILNFSGGIERGFDFLLGWLNYQMLKLDISEDSSNLERNWPYDPEFDYIRGIIMDIARKIFYSFSPQEIDLDPLEFCLKFVQADPRLEQYFSNDIFIELADKYPGISPFLDRAKKNKTGLETDQRRKNPQNLESNPPMEGKV